MSMKAHRGTRVPAGIGSGKLGWKVGYMSQLKRHGTYVPGAALVVQLNDHVE